MSGECQVFADAESSENPRVAILVAELDEAQRRLATILESEGHTEQIAANASFAREHLAEIEAEGLRVLLMEALRKLELLAKGTLNRSAFLLLITAFFVRCSESLRSQRQKSCPLRLELLQTVVVQPWW